MKWSRMILGFCFIAAFPFLLDAWVGVTAERSAREDAIVRPVRTELPVVDRHAEHDSVERLVAVGVGAAAVAIVTRQLLAPSGGASDSRIERSGTFERRSARSPIDSSGAAPPVEPDRDDRAA